MTNNKRIAVLGTGMVGQGIANKLISLGYDVMMGSREKANEKAVAFVTSHASTGRASNGTFAEAASYAEIMITATHGESILSILNGIGAAALANKIIVDISNPLDFSQGMPPSLSIVNTDSLGERIQRAFLSARIVKTLNTVNVDVMVNPKQLAERSDVFVSGNDAAAKATVVDLLKEFGWDAPLDLGDITTARGTEMYLALWIRLWPIVGNPHFNLKIVRAL
jgi:8-hydroxy-5-deazaflavin:NADPH oxidoreductase